MDLVVDQGRWPLVSMDVVRELEWATLRSPGVTELDRRRPFPRILWRIGWTLYAHGWGWRALVPRTFKGRRPVYLAALAGPRFRSCIQYFLRSGRKILYMCDAWPASHPAIREFATALGVETIFVSSSQAADELAKDASWRSLWIPEG